MAPVVILYSELENQTVRLIGCLGDLSFPKGGALEDMVHTIHVPNLRVGEDITNPRMTCSCKMATTKKKEVCSFSKDISKHVVTS